MKISLPLAIFGLAVVASPVVNASDFDDLATVVSVTERTERYNQPRQECSADPVQAAPTNSNAAQGREVGGSIIGGITGALVGSQVGKGNGKVAAAAIGAVTGALVGDRMQNGDNGTANQPTQQMPPEQRCYSYNDNYGNPHRECIPVATSPSAAVSSDRSIGGAAIGGVTGGIVGAQVGKGNGKVAAAAIGAATGAIVGDRVQNGSGTAGQAVQRCRVVDNFVSRVSGYQVTYQYRGNTYTDIVPFNPGQTMRVHVNLTPRG